MNFEYIKFLFISVFKKKATWIVGIFYVLLNALFLMIIPYIVHEDPLVIWSNTLLWSQVYLIFVAALFSGIEAVNIFRDFNDDGTELIIISKPISRAKIITSKFFVFFALSFTVTLTTMVIIPFMYLLPQMQAQYIGSLELSILFTNTVIFLLFGGIAVLFTLKFGKIATIIATVGVATFFSIYSIIVPLVFTTPMTVMMTQKNTTPYTYSFLTYSGENKNAVHFSTAIPIEDSNTMRKMYADCENDEAYVIAQSFNMCAQMTLLYNSFGLKQYSDDLAAVYFASNSWYNYNLEENVYQPFVSSQTGLDNPFSTNAGLPVVFPSFKLGVEGQITPTVYLIADNNDFFTQPDNELAFLYDDNGHKVRLKFDDLYPKDDELAIYENMYTEIKNCVMPDTSKKTAVWDKNSFYEEILYQCVKSALFPEGITSMYDFNLATLKLKFYTFFKISAEWWSLIENYDTPNPDWGLIWQDIQTNENYITINFIFDYWVLQIENHGFTSPTDPIRTNDKYKNYIDFASFSTWSDYMYNFYYFSLEPWISYEVVGVSWASIGLLMYFIAIVVYSREDIK